MEKFMKKSFAIFLFFIMMIATTTNVFATTDFITLGSGSQTKSYIGGLVVPYKITTDGKYLYCTNAKKATPRNMKAFLVKNTTYNNGGIQYILKNGYPLKSITGDRDKDYYITQTAIWWYLDMTTGTSYLNDAFKQSGADTYGLRQKVKNLAYEGYNHRKDSVAIQESKFAISAVNGTNMTLKDGYYLSGPIKATTAQNITDYNVTLTNAPSGTRIVASNGVESVYAKSFKVGAKDSFSIKVPAASLTTTNVEIKVNAMAQGTVQSKVSEYLPSDTTMQTVLLLEQDSKTLPSTINLSIASSKVTISVIDSGTKKALAGAKLVLKNSNGGVVANWTSTTNSHVLQNLANGTYTIEETEAPSGYLINKKTTTFTINDSNKSITINIENSPRKATVSITKIDQDTKQPLSGATLLVRKSDGSEVARFTTNGNAYVLTDIANGTYTLEEVSAPSGYVLNTNKITFVVDDNHLSQQITFVNVKQVKVPDTASSSSIIITILGLVIVGSAFILIKKNERQF